MVSKDALQKRGRYAPFAAARLVAALGLTRLRMSGCFRLVTGRHRRVELARACMADTMLRSRWYRKVLSRNAGRYAPFAAARLVAALGLTRLRMSAWRSLVTGGGIIHPLF
ncbi:MAG: hypothetical protein ABFD97_00555 [Syntrophobacter sp.]